MKRALPYDVPLIATVLLLVGFGLVMVFSVSALVSEDRYGAASTILIRQTTAAMVGLVALLVAARVDYTVYADRRLVIALVTLTVGILLVPHASPGDGVPRWIRIGPLQFQPSELAKVTAILFTAHHLARRDTDLSSFPRGVMPCVGVTAALMTLVLAGRDLGTAVCMGLVVGMLLVLAGIRVLHLAMLALSGAVAFVSMILVEPYRLVRIRQFLDPSQDPHGAGYQVDQSLIALGSGGLTGRGLAESVQKLYFLPEAHTDFVFAVVGEELGLVGCVALIALFISFMYRGLRIAATADTPLGTYLAAGLVSMVVVQALVNMSVVVRLLPTKGLPLPFISVGGSSLMVTLAACGIVLSVSRTSLVR